MEKAERIEQKYENIPVPEELGIRIRLEIEKSARRLERKRKILRSWKRLCHMAGIAAAAVGIALVILLHTNAVLAGEIAGLPLIGDAAQVLMFHLEKTEQEDIGISAQFPSEEMILEEIGGEREWLCQEIYGRCKQYAEEAVLEAETYKDSVLQEKKSPRDKDVSHLNINVYYEMKCQNESYISFAVKSSKSWTAAESESKYYNLSAETGKPVVLEDLLGEHYLELANECIDQQIAEAGTAGESLLKEESSWFTGVSGDVKFYINEKNHPVVVLDAYEAEPGVYTEPEFEIETMRQ